jgi:uncharacterized protein (DUF697 family)
MAGLVSYSFKWDVDPAKKLRDFSRRKAQNILRRAVRKASNVVKSAYQAQAPGRLSSIVGVKISTKAGSSVVRGIIGVRRAALESRNMPANIISLINKGRKAITANSKQVLSNQIQVGSFGYAGPARFFGKRVAAVKGKQITDKIAQAAGGAAQAVLRQSLAEEIAKELLK